MGLFQPHTVAGQYTFCSGKNTFVVALGPLHEKNRLSPRVHPRRKAPDKKGSEKDAAIKQREGA